MNTAVIKPSNAESCTRTFDATENRILPFAKPMIGDAEREAVINVLNGSQLTLGRHVSTFEATFAEFTGASYAVATSSCIGALHLAYLSLGVGSGDEVIVCAQTHVATAHAVEMCGARCVFVDSEPNTGNIDPGAIETRVSHRTKAIAIVHYAGIPANMPRILAVARQFALPVVEDCALALGAYIDGRHVGLWGDAGCFSFYPAKHITTGEGGMLITRRRDVAERAMTSRAFGITRNRDATERRIANYDVTNIGNNYRLTEMAAALGIQQLQRLPEFLAMRRRNTMRLMQALKGLCYFRIMGLNVPPESSACYCLVVVLDESLRGCRDSIVKELSQSGVGTSIYYPHPVPRLVYYRNKYPDDTSEYPVAEELSDASIALPVGPHLDIGDVDYTAVQLERIVAECARS